MNKNDRLNLLIRKNRGKEKNNYCKQILINSGFDMDNLNHYDLEIFDEIQKRLRDLRTKRIHEQEFLSGKTNSFEDSTLLSKIYSSHKINGKCFIYTYDCEDCGIYLIGAEDGFKNILTLTKMDYQKTSYLIDEHLSYSFIITYNDSDHIDHPNLYDIQLYYGR